MKIDKKIVIDSVGGCAYNTLSKILNKLDISGKFDWFNKEETPFFHGIGKDIKGTCRTIVHHKQRAVGKHPQSFANEHPTNA